MTKLVPTNWDFNVLKKVKRKITKKVKTKRLKEKKKGMQLKLQRQENEMLKYSW